MRLVTIIGSCRRPENSAFHKCRRQALREEINKGKTYVAQNGMFLLLALSLAVGLKHHYSTAASEDLTWLLRPTAWLVERISGIPFAQEAGAGFVNYARRIVIAPACAGANFLIIAFCMAVFSGLHHMRHEGLKWLWLAGALIGAYGLTVFVNAVRIIVSIYSYGEDINFGWLMAQRMHRLEGVVIYFFFLCLFYRIISAVLPLIERARSEAEPSADSLRWTLSGLVPLFWYGLITLAVPLLNSAPAREGGRFAEHGGTVISGCLAVLVVLLLLQCGWKRMKDAQTKRP
jgi:exosortase K